MLPVLFLKTRLFKITCKATVTKEVSIRRHNPVISNFWRSLSSEKQKQDISFILSEIPATNIRNFSIIAHIDHGKSTLSDRLLELTGTINRNESNKQVLDKLQVERERGITVKAQTASMVYSFNGEQYLLNLIDTPGHVDFSFEVSRSLAACQGVVLLVDANQGVQAQTVANYNLASSRSLVIIPVLNKIDLKNAKPKEVSEQIIKLFKLKGEDVLQISAKQGTGCESLLTEIINRIPPPIGFEDRPFRGLLFDSWYDKYRGALILVAVMDGSVKVGDEIFSRTNQMAYKVREIGVLSPDEKKVPVLKTGQVGYLALNMKSSKEAKIGDTIHHKDASVDALPKLPAAKPMVFAGFYPADQSQHLLLKTSIEKLTLNDSSVVVQMDSSPALGQGWRLGFLGLLHMEVFSQRLDQEFDVQVVVTAPNVPYKAKFVKTKRTKAAGFDEQIITNPVHFPDPQIVDVFLEPMVLGTIITPSDYLDAVVHLCKERRGLEISLQDIDDRNVILQYKFPLNEVIVDFFDDLKSVSSGYASFDYEDIGYAPTDIKKIDFLLNDLCVEELSMIVHSTRVQEVARRVCLKLSSSIPKQQYEVAIQAALGKKKIIARETIKPFRKNVLAKCYGGDITRKMKLLNRQAEGKKKMRLIGKIEVPRDAFINVLKK